MTLLVLPAGRLLGYMAARGPICHRGDHRARLHQEKVSPLELAAGHTSCVACCAAAQSLALCKVLLMGALKPRQHPSIMLAWETGRAGLSTLFFGGLNANHPTTDPD